MVSAVLTVPKQRAIGEPLTDHQLTPVLSFTPPGSIFFSERAPTIKGVEATKRPYPVENAASTTSRWLVSILQ